MPDRQDHDKDRSLGRRAFNRDLAPMPFHNFAGNRQAGPGAIIGAPAYQAVKRLEKPVGMLLIKSNAVILHQNLDHLRPVSIRKTLERGYLHLRRKPRLGEFECVVNQVGKQQAHLVQIGTSTWVFPSKARWRCR
jgi:hypothetical protein